MWRGVARGGLSLAAVWWAWTCFAWLGASSPAHRALDRTPTFVAMGGVLVAAVAMPDAFGEGALVFGLAYAAVRVIHVALFFVSTRGDAEMRGAVRRLTPTLLVGPSAVVAAAFVESPYRELLWVQVRPWTSGAPPSGG